MIKKIVSLSKQFIAIESVNGKPRELKRALDLALAELSEFTIERFTRNGVRSALVYTASKRPKKFTILLNGHLDVIPAKASQFVPIQKGNRLYGVGSMDMKSNLAVLVYAFRQAAKKVPYPLGLQLVTDEEIGGMNGTRFQVESGVRADFVLAGEPTNFDIVNRAKGVLHVTVTSNGKTAHGAYPWRGDNAVLKMTHFIAALLKKFPVPKKEMWKTTITVSNIDSNNAAINKVPDTCSVNLDIRYIPEDSKTILPAIKKLLPKGFRLSVIINEPAMQTDRRNHYISAVAQSGRSVLRKQMKIRGANGSSDARHYAHVNGAGIEFGPIGGDIGGDTEWVDIKSLEKYYQILTQFLLSQK